MTIQTPYDLHITHSKKDLIGQFIISKNKIQLPNNWLSTDLGNYSIAYHKKLPFFSIPCPSKHVQVYFVGYVVDLKRSTVGTNRKLKVDININNSIEKYLYHLAGRYICIVSYEDKTFIYMDSSGSLSLVYSPQQKMCASTIMSIPYSDDTIDNIELIQELDVENKNNTFAFGLTPRNNIQRLLPNHYLDLSNWKSRRYWPLKNTNTAGTAISKSIKIAKILKKIIHIVCKNHKQVYLSLTAGFDSRVLLACAKKNLDAIDFFTWELPDSIAENDANLAKKIAKKYQLNYSSYPFREAELSDKKLWLYRTGLSAGEVRGLSLTSTVNSMGCNSFYLPGLASEFGRGFYWRKEDSKKTKFSTEDIVKRMGLPVNDIIISAAKDWLEKLPTKDPYQILELLYLEQRLGCWAGVTAYGHAAGPIRLHPFSNREIFELMYTLPQEFKNDEMIPLTIINYYWHELMEYPVNGTDYSSKDSNIKFSLYQKIIRF